MLLVAHSEQGKDGISCLEKGAVMVAYSINPFSLVRKSVCFKLGIRLAMTGYFGNSDRNFDTNYSECSFISIFHLMFSSVRLMAKTRQR